MPYTANDYPDSLKNFDEATRLKAIDIINAMLAEGYEEGDAIPIATAQAKAWAEKASATDKKKLRQKDLTDHSASGPSGARLLDEDVMVQYRDEDKKWEVRTKGALRADSLHDTKKEAEGRAKAIMAHRDSDLIVRRKDEPPQS